MKIQFKACIRKTYFSKFTFLDFFIITIICKLKYSTILSCSDISKCMQASNIHKLYPRLV